MNPFGIRVDVCWWDAAQLLNMEDALSLSRPLMAVGAPTGRFQPLKSEQKTRLSALMILAFDQSLIMLFFAFTIIVSIICLLYY